MKLYATITSERNTKEVGKGGDKYLEIDLHVGSDRIGRIILDHQGGKDWALSYERPGKESWRVDSCITPKKKAEKQQGEEDGVCRKCGEGPVDSYEGICYDCQMKS